MLLDTTVVGGGAAAHDDDAGAAVAGGSLGADGSLQHEMVNAGSRAGAAAPSGSGPQGVDAAAPELPASAGAASPVPGSSTAGHGMEEAAVVAVRSPRCGDRLAYVAPFNEHCYWVISEHISWSVARDLCLQFKASLATITSADEQHFVAQIDSSEPYWIGLARFGSTSFEWVSNEALSFLAWRPAAPSANTGSERAVVLEAGDSAWLDVAPSELHRALCER